MFIRRRIVRFFLILQKLFAWPFLMKIYRRKHTLTIEIGTRDQRFKHMHKQKQ